jgi:hypothetical protein
MNFRRAYCSSSKGQIGRYDSFKAFLQLAIVGPARTTGDPADVGAARAVLHGESAASIPTALGDLTADGQILGTLQYMAPCCRSRFMFPSKSAAEQRGVDECAAPHVGVAWADDGRRLTLLSAGIDASCAGLRRKPY